MSLADELLADLEDENDDGDKRMEEEEPDLVPAPVVQPMEEG